MSIIKRSYHKLGAILTVGFVAGASDSAHAAGATGNTFNTITEQIQKSISDLPGMITGIAYLMGLLLGVLGVLKIKDHVENPGNNPLKDGAIRLAAGGALFALPMVMEAMQNTINKDGAGVSLETLDAVTFDVDS